MSRITDAVTVLAAPEAEKLGLEIWDVEYVREAGQWFLRIYIDKKGGVSIQDCEALSKALDPLLDEADPINQLVGYVLTEDPTYITNYKNARGLIRRIDRDELMAALLKEYLGI